MNRYRLLLFVAIGFASPAEAVETVPAAGTAMPLGRARKPIKAWETFCETPKYAKECFIDLSEPRTIVLTPQVWARLVAVNRLVNRSIRDRSDESHYGRPDVWDLAEDGSGDCEDFALSKRHLLARAGLPMRAMRMTVVSQDGTGHALLTIATDRGDLVLDNQSPRIRFWKDTRYEFIKRESQDQQGWVAIESRPTPADGPTYVQDEQICFRTTPVRPAAGPLESR